MMPWKTRASAGHCRDVRGGVAGVALEVTDDTSLPWEVRKRLRVDQAPQARRAILKLADKIINVGQSVETRRGIGRSSAN